MADPTLQAVAKELGVLPPTVCLSWAVQRENKSGGFVAMATRSDWIRGNLENATRDLLSQEQLVRLCGDGSLGSDGIDANNRRSFNDLDHSSPGLLLHRRVERANCRTPQGVAPGLFLGWADLRHDRNRDDDGDGRWDRP